MRIYDNYDRMTMQRYGTGNAVAYTYDALDRVTAIAYNDSETPAVEYAYDKSGQLCAVIDYCAGTTTRYVYDLSGRVTEETEYTRASLNATGIAHQTTYTYDAKTGQLTAVTRDGVTESYEYGNMRDEKSPETVYAVSRNNQTQWQYTYDALGRRVTSTLVPLGKTTTYTYQNGGHGVNSTSTQLATETTDGVTTAYTYDAVGNITEICKGGTAYTSYQCDSLGQLTNAAYPNGDVYLYFYGDNGNLSQVLKNGEVIKTYAYDTEWWKDQLTSFNGNAITYDGIGNPLTYHNGASMSWDRRQLLSYTHDGTTVAFTYDSVGNRLSKTVGNTATNYVYVGGRLEKQTTGNNTLAFLYDEVGAIYGFTYNGTAYYYERNIQGDVLGIYDSTGTKLVTYTYDAWGALLDMTDTSTNNIGAINPIRYRGYYYDIEMDMYWLSTRFYDPEICRFINADEYVSTGQGVLGNNMYAYCGNNPVSRVDPSGQRWITALVVAIAVPFVTVVGYNHISKRNFKDNSAVDNDESTTTKNKIVNDQKVTTGSSFSYGLYHASWNACETIAVHNAKVIKGIDSSLSETMKDFQSAGAMIGYGFFGSNPYAIGSVLKNSGIEYDRVGLDGMTEPGTYIISFWSENPLRYGLHTVAISYDGTTYTAYNLTGYGSESPISLSNYTNRFICGYYLH